MSDQNQPPEPLVIYQDDNGLKVFATEQQLPDGRINDHTYTVVGSAGQDLGALAFQTGAPASTGTNGVTNEALVALLIHRIRFLNAQVPSKEGALISSSLVQAAAQIEARTRDRLSRGVEGTNQP